MNPLEQLNDLIKEIETSTLDGEAALETFRIRFLGSKNIIKPLSALIRDVPNEQKKEFGQLVNEAKQKAEEVFQQYQEQLAGTGPSGGEMPDLSLPETPNPIGSRHPVSIVWKRSSMYLHAWDLKWQKIAR